MTYVLVIVVYQALATGTFAEPVPALAMGVDHVEFHGREACERAAHGVVLDSHAHGWFASATCWPLGDK